MAFNDWSFSDNDNWPDLTSGQMSSAKLLSLTTAEAIAGYSRGVVEFNPYASGSTNDLFRIQLTAGNVYDITSTSFYDPTSIVIYDSNGKGLVFNSENNDSRDVILSGVSYSKDDIFDWIAPQSGYYYIDAYWNPGVYNTYNFLQIYEHLGTIDSTSPTVLSFSPADGATGVAVVSNVVLTFSEAIQRGTGNIVLKTTAGAVIETYNAATSANLSINGSTLTLNPTADLAFGAQYVVEFAAGTVRDLAGNSYAGAASYDFHTATSAVTGTSQADLLVGTSGVDSIAGQEGNDTLNGAAGNDELDGGPGIDLAVYSATRAVTTWNTANTGFTVTSTLDGTDTLVNIERLQFSDISVALDLAGNAGTVAKILGAVFGPAEVANEVYAGIGLYYIDGGMTYESLMQLALDARLGSGADNQAIVDVLYTNVVGVPPGVADRAYFVGLLDSGAFTIPGLGVYAADYFMNLESINLVGLAEQGLEYVPYVEG